MTITAIMKPEGGPAAATIADIEATVNALTEELHTLQQVLHANPELAFEEKIAHDACVEYMRKQEGWKITPHAYGVPTAWEAVFDNGAGPVVGYNSEMDALRQVGHACGHNLICITGIAAALGHAAALKKFNIPGKVVLLGTPAEEAGGGKTVLIKNGAYDGMDICLMSHPMIKGTAQGVPRMNCIAAFSIDFHGKSAHAAGVNALDAAVAAYMNIALLRQQISDPSRLQLTLKGSENWSANVIASESSILLGVRAPTAQEVLDLVPRALNCMKAGALASGCTVDIHRDILYLDVQQSRGLAAAHQDVCETGWAQFDYHPDVFMTASTDFGDVTYKCPALHPLFYLPDAAEGDFPHSDTFAQWTGLRSSTVAALRAGAGLAALGFRATAEPAWTASVRTAWEAQIAGVHGAQVAKDFEELLKDYPRSDSTIPKPCQC